MRLRATSPCIVVAVAACGRGDAPPPDACAPAILYLNRTGGDFTAAPRDDARVNRSELVDGVRTLAPYPKTEDDWASLTACIRAGLAPFPITITETDPGTETPHDELVFTTSYWGGSPGFQTVIPDRCGPDHGHIAFVFGDALATRARACDVTLRSYAQMIASLSFGDRCDDLVNDMADCVPIRTYVDAEATCVDAFTNPAPCRCGGATQNSFAAMQAAIATCD